MLSIGGHGVISVAAHLVGLQMKDMINKFLAGKVSEAADIHLKLMPLIKASLCIESCPG
jgi:4-hydroxy-tetrahydrodipicolinate synthase